MHPALKRKVATVVVIGGLLLATAIVGSQATKPKMVGGSISETFATGDPCATANLALAVPAGSDPADTAETLFAPLRAMGVINTARYNPADGTLVVGFCESKSSEAAVRSALAPTGLIAQ